MDSIIPAQRVIFSSSTSTASHPLLLQSLLPTPLHRPHPTTRFTLSLMQPLTLQGLFPLFSTFLPIPLSPFLSPAFSFCRSVPVQTECSRFIFLSAPCQPVALLFSLYLSLSFFCMPFLSLLCSLSLTHTDTLSLSDTRTHTHTHTNFLLDLISDPVYLARWERKKKSEKYV